MALITVSGTLKDPSGNPTAGSVTFQLANYGASIPRVIGTNSIVATFVSFVASTAGTWSGSIQGNDTIDPGGTNIPPTTFYEVSFKDTAGNTIATLPFQFTGSGPANLDSQAPLNPVPSPFTIPSNAALLGANQTFTGNNTFQGTTTINSLALVGAVTITGGGTLGGTFSGNPTLSGNVAFTGAPTIGNLNSVIFVDGVKYTTFASAVAACTNPGTVVVPPGTFTVSSNLSVPSTCTINVMGGILSINTGVTLTINGQIQAPQGSQIFTGLGTVSIPASFMSVYAAWFPGADVGAQTQAAITSCPSNCRIWLPDQGTLSYSTPINMAVGASNGVHLIGAGEGATILTYTGSATRPAVSFGCTTNATLEFVQITTANTTGTGVSMCGTNNKFLNSTVNGFGTTLRVTGSGSPSFIRSFKTRVQNINVSGYSAVGVQIDHAIDTYLDFIEGFGATDNTTTQDLVVDTGTSGLYVNGLSVGYGLNGLIVQKVLNDGGAPAAYNSGPLFLRFSSAFFDTIDGGDACKFDSTLGNNPVDAVFDINCWCSAAGLNVAGSVITTTANGLGIYGGNGITFMGKARRNANCGVLINPSTTSNFIKITDAWITANNVNNNAGGHGISIAAACTNVSITNNHIGNELDAGGNQKFGISVAAVNSDILSIEHNHLENNVSGALSNSNTGNTWVWGNTPMAGATQNIVWGGTTFTNNIGFANTLLSNTAPTISSGFGTSPSIAANNGTAAFTINVGGGGTATNGVIGLPTAANGWNCYATDVTTNSSTVFITKQISSTTTTCTIGNFNTSAVGAAWGANDILRVSCFAF